MLTYFHKNKGRYEKGQLAPVFILVLVVLIIMAMVTLNISKVAQIKTDAGNAADAGALAGGSVMANVFNMVAAAAKQMEVDYWEYFVVVSVSFIIAIILVWTSNSTNCYSPWSIGGLLIGVLGFSLAQYYYYRSTRQQAAEGRESAKTLSHKLAFINSGIGGRLKEGDYPGALTGGEDDKNYRDRFSAFLDQILTADQYSYSWKDGQGREHFVQVNTEIEQVDNFEVTVTFFSLTVEIILLVVALIAAVVACYGTVPIVVLIAKIVATVLLIVSWIGLFSGSIDMNPDAERIPCWINDIQHNHLVRVESTQHHQGADLGLWQARYPDSAGNTYASAVAYFAGYGDISPPDSDPRFDASLIQAD